MQQHADLPSWVEGLTPLAYHGVIAMAIILAFVLLHRVVRAFLNVVGRKIIAKTETELDDRILDVVLANVRPMMIVTGLFVAVREVVKGIPETEATLLQLAEYARAILYILAIMVVVKIVIGIVREFIQWYLGRAAGGDGEVLGKTLGPLVTKLINFLVALVGLIVILDHFGINIGSLLVSLGVGSLAVALAAQETLANMIAGFVILVDRPFRVGDRVEVAPGIIGDVLAIGLRSTRVLNYDHNVIVIPNAELVKSRVVNFAHPFNQMRVLLRFELAYGSDVSKVRDLLLGLVKEQPDILADPAPSVAVTGLTDSAVQVTLVARCSDFSKQYAAETALREKAYAAFVREGIAMPVALRVIRMEQEQKPKQAGA